MHISARGVLIATAECASSDAHGSIIQHRIRLQVQPSPSARAHL